MTTYIFQSAHLFVLHHFLIPSVGYLILEITSLIQFNCFYEFVIYHTGMDIFLVKNQVSVRKPPSTCPHAHPVPFPCLVSGT